MADYAIQFVPEEHAPDPVHGKGDAVLPGKIGIWLFLASEIMFFMAILGSYLIYRSSAPAYFAKNAETLSKLLAGVNTVVLIFSSLTMALAVTAAKKGDRKKTSLFLGITVACALAFLGIKAFEYNSKFTHYTFQRVEPATSPGGTPTIAVYDGHVREFDGQWLLSHGYRVPMEKLNPGPDFQLNLLLEPDIKRLGEPFSDSETIPMSQITNSVNYGPWRNIFFSSYFTLTGIHGLHVIGGIIPLTFLLAHSLLRGKTFPRHTEYVGLYWHFVDLVWIFLFPLMYLI